MASKELDGITYFKELCECGKGIIETKREYWSYCNWNGGDEIRNYVSPCPICGSKSPMKRIDFNTENLKECTNERLNFEFDCLTKHLDDEPSYHIIDGKTIELHGYSYYTYFLALIINEQLKRGDE